MRMRTTMTLLSYKGSGWFDLRSRDKGCGPDCLNSTNTIRAIVRPLVRAMTGCACSSWSVFVCLIAALWSREVNAERRSKCKSYKLYMSCIYRVDL